MQYAEFLKNCCNAVGGTFYEAIAAAILSAVCLMASISPGISSHAVILSSGPPLTRGIR